MSCIICSCARIPAGTLEKRKQILQGVFLAGQVSNYFFICSTCKREMTESNEHSSTEQGQNVHELDDSTKDRRSS
jgi:hypothetical protein